MFDNYKLSLLHFETDGKNISHDFVTARLEKAAKLRTITNVCFYIQCTAAICCIVAGIALSEQTFAKVFSALAGVSVIVIALFALGGHTGERTAAILLDIVYSVTCFFMGGMGMYFCGGLLISAAAAATVGLIFGYFRGWLMGFPEAMLRKEHYTLIETDEPEEEELPPPPEPEPPKKSELMEIAETFMEILK